MIDALVMPISSPTGQTLRPALYFAGPFVGRGVTHFQWVENWVRLPDTASGRANGRTHGVVISEQGHAVIFNQADPAILVYDRGGELVYAWGDRFPGAHGLTLVKEGNTE